MSNPGQNDTTPIDHRAQLVEVLAQGCKPQQEWRIGTEHEKFGFLKPQRADDNRPAFSAPPYEPHGIKALLEGLASDLWQPIDDNGAIIGLKGRGAHKGRSISLEPAGQFELSGAPLRTVHETKSEMDDHFASLRAPTEQLGIGFAALGFQPFCSRSDLPWMPKSRYAIMRRYMPTVGQRGLDMMQRTCTVQVNLDFSDEADMARKMRVSLALQPLITALMANSPFIDGKPTGWLSNRGRTWLDTDNQRSGQPSLFLEEGFGFERYVEWLLDVPMYFVNRDGKMIDAAGCSFRRWLAGDEQGPLEGLTPTIGDFEDHITTAFPDVRLKQFLEMRGADAGRSDMMVAHSALWVGLLYDPATLAAVESLVREQPWDVYQTLHQEAPRLAMNTPFPGGGLRALAKRVLALSEQGLIARQLGEESFLAPLHEIAEGAPTQAERWLQRYHTVWNGDVTRIYEEAEI